MDYQDIILEKENGISILTLNRPDRMNAITRRMFSELYDAITTIEKDDDTKVLILTGAGERAFCAGADAGTLADVAGDKSGVKVEFQKSWGNRWEKIQPIGWIGKCLYYFNKPVIGAMNGVAAGAGLSLAMLCDIRIACEEARFTFAFVKRGLIPDCAATYSLPRLVGTPKALELMWTGDIIYAAEAERIGLVNKVVTRDKLMDETKEFARRLTQGPSIAIELTKWAVRKSLDNDFDRQLDFESRAQQICNTTEDFKEGVRSLLEKREGHFQGR